MKSWNKAMMIGVLAGIATGFLCAGCGKKGAAKANNPSGEATVSSQTAVSIKWSYKGTGFTAVTVLAKKHTFFGKSGVMVTFYDENVPPGASAVSTSKKNRVEVFFPAQDSGYGKPISVAFHEGSKTIVESKGGGYNGQLTASSRKLHGELNINKIGYNEDCSITGSFETTLIGQ